MSHGSNRYDEAYSEETQSFVDDKTIQIRFDVVKLLVWRHREVVRTSENFRITIKLGVKYFELCFIKNPDLLTT